MSPTQHTLKYLRAHGWLAAVVEKWNGHARIRQDLFGFGDVIAVKGDVTLLVQATSMGNMGARLVKIANEPNVRLWLESPYRQLSVFGWAKRGPRGKRKVWTLKEERILPWQ